MYIHQYLYQNQYTGLSHLKLYGVATIIRFEMKLHFPAFSLGSLTTNV